MRHPLAHIVIITLAALMWSSIPLDTGPLVWRSPEMALSVWDNTPDYNSART